MWIMRTYEYRLDAILGIIGSTFWVVGAVLFINFLYLKINSIAGWDKYDLMLFLGVSQVFAYLFFCFTYYNMKNVSKDINSGNFDWYLIKPVNKFLYPTMNCYHPASLVSLIAPSIILFYALSHKQYFLQIPDVCLSFICIIISVLIIHFFQIIFASFSFWFTEVNLWKFFDKTSDISRYPYEVFNSPLIRFIFLTIIPYALIVNIPIRALLGQLSIVMFVLQIVVLVMFISISRYIWFKGLKVYGSASS